MNIKVKKSHIILIFLAIIFVVFIAIEELEIKTLDCQILLTYNTNKCRLEKENIVFHSKKILFFKILDVERIKAVSRGGVNSSLRLTTSIGVLNTSFDEGVIDKINIFLNKSEPKNLHLIINQHSIYPDTFGFIFFGILAIISLVLILLSPL